MPADDDARPTAAPSPAPFGFQSFSDDTPRRTVSDPRRRESMRIDPAWTGPAAGPVGGPVTGTARARAAWTPAPPPRAVLALDTAEPAAARSVSRHLAWPLAACAAAFAVGLASGPLLHRLAPAAPAAPAAPSMPSMPSLPPVTPQAAVLPPLAAPSAAPTATGVGPGHRPHSPAAHRPAAPGRAQARAPARAAVPCAGSPAQRMVCRDATLAALDGRLRRAYGHALAVTAAPRTLRRDQDDWLNAREDTARISRGAVIRLYQARIAELEAAARNSRRRG